MNIPETPYYSHELRSYLPLPPTVPEKYVAALPALRTYTALQLRLEHPEGNFDRAGRWYPSAGEARECCRLLRSPSRSYPFSLLTHCRTAKHVANVFQVEPRALRGLLAWLVRYYTAVGTAPALCAVCGASWVCEHSPYASEAEAAGLLAVPEDRADMTRHIANF